jgi:hypothetical protein
MAKVSTVKESLTELLVATLKIESSSIPGTSGIGATYNRIHERS